MEFKLPQIGVYKVLEDAEVPMPKWWINHPDFIKEYRAWPKIKDCIIIPKDSVFIVASFKGSIHSQYYRNGCGHIEFLKRFNPQTKLKGCFNIADNSFDVKAEFISNDKDEAERILKSQSRPQLNWSQT